jgi:hypothetical protein
MVALCTHPTHTDSDSSRIIGVYTLKKRINITIVRADCKQIGLHSGWTKRKSGSVGYGNIYESKLRALAGSGQTVVGPGREKFVQTSLPSCT